jgi:hypothetical protein
VIKHPVFWGVMIGIIVMLFMESVNILVLAWMNNQIYLWFLRGTYWYSVGIVLAILLLSAILGYGITKKSRVIILIPVILFITNIGFLVYHIIRVMNILYKPPI